MSAFLTLVHHYINLSILHINQQCHDKEKKHKYQQWVENASFSSLIFTTSCGIGDGATQFCKRLANLLSVKHSSDGMGGM